MSTAGRRAIVTNDDGIASEGLRLLADAAVSAGLDVVVAAPDQEASGSGAAMTVVAAEERVVVERRELAGLIGVPVYAVRAVPGFIAFTGVRGALGPSPALLLSGINRGPNTGRAILHSGTVGAAMTAAGQGVRAAAFSLDVRSPADGVDASEHWETASAVARRIIPALHGMPHGVVLNVNVPNVPLQQLRGIRRGTLAQTGAVEINVVEAGADYLQVTMSDVTERPRPGTDSALLAAGYATVTLVLPLCELHGEDLSWLPEGRITTEREQAAAAADIPASSDDA